ncbi:DUF6498-containing protein [bacterium]|nr:DUF6498-containing protein [bacterium]
MNLQKIIFYPSVLVLVVVNLMPLAGILFFTWDIFTVMILYWLESAVIGFFNILKMQKVSQQPKELTFVPFFIVHYSIFMIGHLFFIVKIFSPNVGNASDMLSAFGLVLSYLGGLFITLSFLFLSHGVSFIYNFIKKKEYLQITIKKQMAAPYKRIMIMHLALILGGIAVASGRLGGDMGPIIILVILKIFFDLLAHIKEHRKVILNT